MEFTEEQLAIIHHQEGHARVSAVAGSGKTTTMIARVGELLRRGVRHNKMMVLMFNRSARDSFAQTMQTMLRGQGETVILPEIRTFHSLGYRLTQSLTKKGALASLHLEPREFIAEQLAKKAASKIWQQQGSEERESRYLPKEYVEEFLTFIDLVKGSIEPVDIVYRSQKLENRFSFFVPAFTLFEQLRLQQGLRFYNDLIAEPLQAIVADPALAEWIGNRMDYIIVDEYQDINESQQELLKIVAGSRAQVMVVGDVDQCIYEWRGAKPAYINSYFTEDFSPCVDYTLSYTFRYGHALSLVANHLIGNNFLRDDKLCISHKSNGATKLRFHEESAKQVSSIIGIVKDWCENGRQLNDAVVLVRLYAQSVTVELALLSAAIPYRLEGGEDIFSCEEIQALMGYLYLARGRFVELALEESRPMLLAMLSQPHLGIKRKEIEALSEKILPLLHAADEEGAIGVLDQGISRKLAPFIQKHFLDAAENWRWICKICNEGNISVGKLLRCLVERLKLYDFYRSFSVRAETAENRIKICEALISFAEKRDCGVDEFIDRMRTFANLRHNKESSSVDSLLITSIHRAKGLEWPLVILPGLAEGSVPFFRERDGSPHDSELEDERRLFYVAITRAIEELVLLYPPDKSLQKAIKLGQQKREKEQSWASRFLFEANLGMSTSLGTILDKSSSCEEIKRELRGENVELCFRYLESTGNDGIILLHEIKKEEKDDAAGCATQWRRIQLHELGMGLQIRHPEFGEGLITAVRDRKSGRITVEFPQQEREVMLLASKARLEIRKE